MQLLILFISKIIHISYSVFINIIVISIIVINIINI